MAPPVEAYRSRSASSPGHHRVADVQDVATAASIPTPADTYAAAQFNSVKLATVMELDR